MSASRTTCISSDEDEEQSRIRFSISTTTNEVMSASKTMLRAVGAAVICTCSLWCFEVAGARLQMLAQPKTADAVSEAKDSEGADGDDETHGGPPEGQSLKAQTEDQHQHEQSETATTRPASPPAVPQAEGQSLGSAPAEAEKSDADADADADADRLLLAATSRPKLWRQKLAVKLRELEVGKLLDRLEEDDSDREQELEEELEELDNKLDVIDHKLGRRKANECEQCEKWITLNVHAVLDRENGALLAAASRPELWRRLLALTLRERDICTQGRIPPYAGLPDLLKTESDEVDARRAIEWRLRPENEGLDDEELVDKMEKFDALHSKEHIEEVQKVVDEWLLPRIEKRRALAASSSEDAVEHHQAKLHSLTEAMLKIKGLIVYLKFQAREREPFADELREIRAEGEEIQQTLGDEELSACGDWLLWKVYGLEGAPEGLVLSTGFATSSLELPAEDSDCEEE